MAKNPFKKSAKIKREQTAEQAEAAAKAAKPKTRGERKRAAKEKLGKGAKYVLVAIGVLAMLLSVTAMACSGILNQASNKSSYTLTGGVAATVNGINIKEDTITKQVMSVRNSGSYDTDKKWAQYLVDNDKTPESLRQGYIDGYVNQILIQQAIKENNITVSQEDIDKKWDEMAKSYGGEDKLITMLTQIGYTEDTYKSNLESSLAQEKLKKKVSKVDDPTDEELVSYINENLSTYNDARRSENLLVKVDSDASDEDKEKARATAQEALDKINSGELTFEQAVEKYSEDTGSKDDDGDVGWDKLTTFVDEYQTALSALSKDQVSGIVETSYGYHLIKCTDVFHVDGEVTSADQVPGKIRDYVKNIITTQAQSEAYTTWYNDYKDAADIKVNDMPKDVPYNVSLKGVEKSASDSSSTSDSSASSDSSSDDSSADSE